MNLRELVIKNRSFRGFDSNRILTKAEITEILEVARWVASSYNMQPLKYYISVNKDEIHELMKEVKLAKLLEVNLPLQNKEPTGVILICHDTKISSSISMYQIDIGVAAQTILLKATEEGLGGCMVGSFDKMEVRRITKLDDRYSPELIIILGKPDETVFLCDAGNAGTTRYFRDEEGNHYVPKRLLDDIIIK